MAVPGTGLAFLRDQGCRHQKTARSCARMIGMTETFREAVRLIASAKADSLSTLSLEGLDLVSLPEELSELVSLRDLTLRGNRLTALPEWIGGLKKLSRLDVDNNQLIKLPDSIGNLCDLTELTLRGNKLTCLPGSIGNLTKLTKLDVNNNQLTNLPETLVNLTGLIELYLGDNDLTRLPEDIGKFVSLARLDADNNRIAQLPESIGRLASLAEIDLGANLLTILPESIGNLASLTTLYLGYNLIDTLPDSFGNLTNLTRLTLRGNRITILPESLGSLPRLSRLSLDGNPLTEIGPEVVASGTGAVLAFLRARGQEPPVRQWISKLLVVGDSSAGKTSLVKALHGQPHDPSEPSTHGLGITALDLSHPERADTVMSLSVWDFGGQDIYHATHQFFLTGRSLFLLVWNARTGADRARFRYWLETVTARAPGSPILMVATHTADWPADIDLKPLMRDYPQIAGHLSVDCASREGIAQLIAAVAGQAAALPLMGQPWPRAWTRAADTLASGKHPPHVTDGQMRQIMAQTGVRGSADQDALAQVLHYRGQILYYPGDPDLSDTIILDPRWLNARISALLDARGPGNHSGVLTRADVEWAWGEMPEQLRRQILALMQRYDVCYLVDEPQGEALAVAVSRLPQSPPDYAPAWDKPLQQPGCREIRVRYRLPVLPPGIPAWFLARSHRFSTGVQWRYGALLSHPDGEHTALINANVEQGTVELTVRGPLPASFFAVLDDGLNLTFDRYPGMNIARLIPCCGHNGRACPKIFSYAKLIDRLRRGHADMYCDEAEEPVSITELLLGIGPTRRDLGDAALRRYLSDITAGIRQLAEQAQTGQRSFMKLQNLIQESQETRCPSVFLIVPARNTLGKKTYNLRLYCEEPGAWHPLPGEVGCYKITQLPKWLRTAGPHIHRTLRILATASPIAGSILNIAAGELNSTIQQDITLATQILTAIPATTGSTVKSCTLDEDAVSPRSHAETEADFRVVEAMLLELDPRRTWGGLSRTLTPEGLTLYLCADHYASYRTTAIDCL